MDDRERNGEDESQRQGSVDPEIGRTLGGTGSHHRASYSDPTPAAGARLVKENDEDRAVTGDAAGAGTERTANAPRTGPPDARSGQSRPRPSEDALRGAVGREPPPAG